jgi:peptidyl-prolyl cis-trans isomerase B (cyclophilin B)
MIAEKLIDSEYEKTEHYTFSKAQQTIYKTIGGTPHLDTNYTVFGEVIEGLEVIDKIAQAKTNKDDRPLIDLRMKISIIK